MPGCLEERRRISLFLIIACSFHCCLPSIFSSWFYDAPLSHLGLSQVEDLHKFLKSNKLLLGGEGQHVKILRADPGAPPSKILCSNLRRAASTMAAGFRSRLSRRLDEKILVHPSLQEIRYVLGCGVLQAACHSGGYDYASYSPHIVCHLDVAVLTHSRNPDTLSITPPMTQIQASWVDKTSKLCDFQTMFTNQFDMSLHTGNKPLNTNGLKRMTEFCEFCFSTSVREEYIIVGGHSIWFRSFFKTFLPHKSDHVAKTKKIRNCGVVAFDLLKTMTKYGPSFMVDPESVRVVYGGF